MPEIVRPIIRQCRSQRRAGRFCAPVLAVLLLLSPGRTRGEETAAAVSPDHAEKMAEGLALFQSQARGLLTRHCLECHGGKKVEGDFSLADRDKLLEGGASGPAIVPGNSADSLLYKLIAHADEPGMPFERPQLASAEIDQIARWIDLGAPYDKPLVEEHTARQGRSEVTDADRRFWSFGPLRGVTPPEVQNQWWCRTPIDRFVAARLETAGIRPNAAVDRRRLIRRAYLDLLGLPPDPEAVQAFVDDPDPRAYEKLIDQLLASPHYGERWARHWLDLARFAESHGYEQDYDRQHAYHYRDFVIRALNDDMPYDRFVRLQIGGDEFEPDNPLAFCATGFLGAGTHATQITANQVEKERYDELDDMLNTTGTAILGLTIGCARCHDHKYDPIPTTDYYRMLATFTTTVRSEIELDFHPERYRAAKASFDAEHAPLVEALERYEREELGGRLAQWLVDHKQVLTPTWLEIEPRAAVSSGGATLTRQPDGSYLAQGRNPAWDVYTFEIEAPLEEITALRIEALADGSLPKSGPGRAANGNFALSNVSVRQSPLATALEPTAAKLARPRASFEQKGLAVAAAIDDDPQSAWAVDPEFGRNHAAVFEFDPPLRNPGGTSLTVVLDFDGNTGHNIGRPRIAVSGQANPPLEVEPASFKEFSKLNQILALQADERSPTQQETLLAWFATIDPEHQRLRECVEEHARLAPKPELTKVMVASEGYPPIRLHTQGADFFNETYQLKRGDLSQKIEVASQGFLRALSRAAEGERYWQEPPPAGSQYSYRRRALANWLTDAEQGAGSLAARVIVNRLWQHHFGRGIVATASDFGAQGERPTHPELLEWLANRLVLEGWRLKPLHRLMMTSAVYLESVELDDHCAKIDPENHLLWRRNRQRLEAEAVRDCMLAVSGILDRTLYGPGTLDENQRRRSIYFFVKRSKLIPLMVLFDAPEPLTPLAVRPTTTVAPQALALLNNQQLYDCARALAERILPEARVSLEGALTAAYRQALARSATPTELQEARQFVAEQTKSYEAAGASEALSPALADFCQALLCLNEFIYVE